MKPPYYYNIDPKDIKPGDEFCGYERPANKNGTHSSTMCHIVVSESGEPLCWGKDPIEGEVAFFHRKLTWQERDEWYRNAVDMANSRNQMNLMGLHADLYDISDARHEMWNGWIQTTWEEQLIELLDEDFFIIGIVDPAPPRMGLPMRHPVAIVIEYEDGDRYWCHAEKNWIDDMRQESMTAYRKLVGE